MHYAYTNSVIAWNRQENDNHEKHEKTNCRDRHITGEVFIRAGIQS